MTNMENSFQLEEAAAVASSFKCNANLNLHSDISSHTQHCPKVILKRSCVRDQLVFTGGKINSDTRLTFKKKVHLVLNHSSLRQYTMYTIHKAFSLVKYSLFLLFIDI